MAKFKIPKRLPCKHCSYIIECANNGNIDIYCQLLERREKVFSKKLPDFLSVQVSCKNFDPDDMSISEVVDTLTEWQKKVLYYLVGKSISDEWKSTGDRIRKKLNDDSC